MHLTEGVFREIRISGRHTKESVKCYFRQKTFPRNESKIKARSPNFWFSKGVQGTCHEADDQ